MRILDLIRCLWKGRIIGRCKLCGTPMYTKQGHYYFSQRFNEEWMKKNEVPNPEVLEVHDSCAKAYCIHHEKYWF